MKPQKTLANLGKKNNAEGTGHFILQNTLQRHSNKINMVLTQKQTFRLKVQNRRPKHEYIQL